MSWLAAGVALATLVAKRYTRTRFSGAWPVKVRVGTATAGARRGCHVAWRCLGFATDAAPAPAAVIAAIVIAAIVAAVIVAAVIVAAAIVAAVIVAVVGRHGFVCFIASHHAKSA